MNSDQERAVLKEEKDCGGLIDGEAVAIVSQYGQELERRQASMGRCCRTVLVSDEVNTLQRRGIAPMPSVGGGTGSRIFTRWNGVSS
jgi:hypothetical protein